MFTGIIEEVGTLTTIKREPHLVTFTIEAHKVLEGLALGNSISVNGVCLTVTKFDPQSFMVEIMPETLKKTALANYQTGDSLNLERALTLESRLGGHLVSGHVDTTATLTTITPLEKVHELNFRLTMSHQGLMIPKGSVALDGISLTLMDVTPTEFSVGIIPHTLKMTNLGETQVGEMVNIEFDMIGKFIQAQQFAYQQQ